MIKSLSTIKGEKISDINSVSKQRRIDNSFNGYIEIVSFKKIENGVEVFARAWDENNKQIGFGDGTIDIERFVIMNPPILVEDKFGDIKREWTHEITKEPKSRNLKEDPQEAILQVLAHTISIKKEKSISSNIISGKIGRSTLVVYPDAGTGGTTVDGRLNADSLTNWSTVREATTGTASPTGASGSFTQGEKSGDAWNISRAAFLFDTSALTDDVDISSAVFSLYATGDYDNSESNFPADPVVISSNPASNNNLVAADYNITNWGTTYLSDVLDLSVFSSSGYKNFTINATGIAAISKTGITKYGTRGTNDIGDFGSPTARSYAISYFADQTGTTNDPKLVIEYTPSTSIKSINGLAYASIKSINGLAIGSIKSFNGLE